MSRTRFVEDEVTVVTGGAAGIGAGTARRFGEEGARVVVGDIDVEGGTEVVEEIVANGGEATFVEADVSESSDFRNLVETAVETYGSLDVLFNNAGIPGPETSIVDVEEEEFDTLVDVNLKGVWLGMKYGIPAMLETGGGAIVNNSSITGQSGFPEYGVYGATKAGISLMTSVAAMEYVEEGIRVNAIAPGVVNTSMLETLMEKDPEAEAEFRAVEPMPGLAEVEEIANAVLFLASEYASRVTGTTLSIDGGVLS